MSLELAIRYARDNPIQSRGRSSISRMCTVLTDGRRVFWGWNSYKTSPLQARFSQRTDNPQRICTHSEIAAIAKAVRRGKVTDFSKYKMYVARLLADGTTALARPCVSCQQAIEEFGIQQVEYTE